MICLVLYFPSTCVSTDSLICSFRRIWYQENGKMRIRRSIYKSSHKSDRQINESEIKQNINKFNPDLFMCMFQARSIYVPVPSKDHLCACPKLGAFMCMSQARSIYVHVQS